MQPCRQRYGSWGDVLEHGPPPLFDPREPPRAA
jgi:hypothetical protein